MALTKTTKVDKIEVVDTGDWKMVQVRTATVITEDGTELSRSFHRHVVAPSDDWSSEDSEVQAICNACLLYTSPSPRDGLLSRMPSSA